ncbi:MAG: PAS domain S-box protein, partial [Deltaproteobacteria bacterium]|nr:PAS domain S-box protein [Deltaproteobacteria bacterium]
KEWFRLRFVPVNEGVLILSTDVTATNAAQEALRRSARVAGMARACRTLIAAHDDEATLLTALCQRVAERGGYHLAWVGMAEAGPERRIRLSARHGVGAELLDGLDLTWGERDSGLGPAGRAIRDGQVVVARFVDEQPGHEHWRRRAVELGFRSSVALPLEIAGRTAGVLCIYAAELDAFEGAEQLLLEDLALDLGDGLTSLRARRAAAGPGALEDRAAREALERRRAVQALGESEARYRLLLDEAPVGIAVLCEGQVVFTNAAGARILGAASPAQLVGRRVEQIVHPSEHAASRARMAQMLGGEGSRYPAESRYLRLDGAAVDVEVHATAITFEGKPAIQVIVTDITERKRTQEDLRRARESSERLERIINKSPAVAFSWSARPGEPVEYVSENFAQFGYRPEALLRGELIYSQIIHPDDRDRVREEVVAYAAVPDCMEFSQEYRVLTASGEVRWVDDRTWVVRTEGGEVAGFHGVVLDVTDRVRVQEALRESERMFSKLFRMSPMGIIIHRISDGRAVLVNDAFLQILGYDHEEIIGRRAEDVGALVEPEAREHWMATLRDEGSVHGVYATIRKRSGEPRHVLASMQLVVLEGEVMVMVLAEDVTDRRRVEEEARRARERLEEAMDLAHMASWDYDRGTREFTFNDRLYALCGTSAAAEGGYRMTFDAYRDRFVAAPDQARVGEELRRALSNPDPNHVARMEHRLVRPDGQERHVVVRFVMERDAQGDVIRTHGVNQDITERKRAEAALLESEAFVRVVMDNLPIGVAVCEAGPAVRFSYMNDAFPRIYRTTRGALEVPGGFWEAAYEDEAQRSALRERVQADLASADPERMHWSDIPITRAGKVEAYVTVHWVPMPGSDRMISIVRDVTARRRAELERASMEEQFLAAQKMEAVGRLAGGVAHDFNNLLSVIMSYARFALDGLDASDPMQEDLREISRAGERAAALTRQLLAFSRKQVLQPEVLSLNAVVAGLEKMLLRLLGEDVGWRVYLADDLAPVLADPGQLEQVLMNLVINARDAMPKGGVITVETSNVVLQAGHPALPFGLPPGRYVALSVADSGVGMDEETREHIFEPFFTTKEKGKGTGLGLSTVYGIVQQSGGVVQVESAPGAGSTFRIHLPVAEGARIDERRSPRTLPVSGNEVVLVVEDDAAVRRLSERILRAAGFRVFSAASGGDALVVCEQEGARIDLMLADVVMPRMSGPELARRVGAQWPRIKVLFMSGYTDDALGQHGVLSPDVAFIGKPFTPVMLALKVRAVLDEKPS